MPHRSHTTSLFALIALSTLACRAVLAPSRPTTHVAVVRPVAVAASRAPTSETPPVTVPDLSSGCAQSCAIRADRSVWCWGAALEGAPLGPRRVGAIDEARSLACGASHCCALRVRGGVTCWRIPSRATTEATTPVEMPLDDVTQIASGGDATCALRRSGEVSCWQSRAEGRSYTAPRALRGLDGARQIAVGPTHGCALQANGSVRCWGHNADGQLGPDVPRDRRRVFEATPVPGVPESVEITVGDRHSCARSAAGEVWCWGSNASGQSGIGPFAGTSEPLRVQGVTGALGLAAGASHTCVVLGDRSVECWGDNRTNAIGEIRPSVASSPVPVPTIDRALRVAPSCDATCALHEDGSVRCWGARYASESSPRGRPVRVSLP
jgi:alpha-tubulin suppressor-like RCC1 family protein